MSKLCRKNQESPRIYAGECQETSDPAVFIVEFKGVIDVKLTGKTYNNNYCGVFTIQNSKLVHYKEYFDPIILQTAFGTKLQENFNVNE
ncbi:MAG: hypothetical protein KME31_14385 [Tolypothrix carrinoi HA7290-LM1]|nr:hypothetical protein [Tolypothrix carrinoi HA7290-LM1]